jgi:uncharacterized protein (DUF58 family)
MLYPDFNELVKMDVKRARLGLESRRPTLAAAAGNYSSPFRGQGLAFHEVRDYRPGDDVRNIDWRVTARMNKPHMKVYTEDRERTVMLCIDANASMRFGTRGTFKSVQAARAAALLGWLANGSHDRVGCLLFGDVPDGMALFKPARSRNALWRALKALSRQETSLHTAPVPIEAAIRRLDRAVPAGSLIFIVSDFQEASEALEKSIGSLRQRCDVVPVRIDDPADGVIPPLGPIRFSDAQNRKISINTDSRSGQEAYAAKWLANRNRFEDICARRGIRPIVLHTNTNIRDDLLPGLRRLAQKRRR